MGDRRIAALQLTIWASLKPTVTFCLIGEFLPGLARLRMVAGEPKSDCFFVAHDVASKIGRDDLLQDGERMHRQSLYCHTVASLVPSLLECPTPAGVTASFGTASCFAIPVAGSGAQKYEKARCERAFSRATNLLQQRAEALLDKPCAYHSIP